MGASTPFGDLEPDELRVLSPETTDETGQGPVRRDCCRCHDL